MVTTRSPILLAIVLAGLTAPAQAADGPWRLLTNDRTASTSRCIGVPRTPLCAVETLLACFQTNQAALCRLVDGDVDQYAQIFDEPAETGKYLAYRVLEMTPDSPDTGDHAQILIEQRQIETGHPIDGQAGSTSRFQLRRDGNGLWKIESWDDLAQ